MKLNYKGRKTNKERRTSLNFDDSDEEGSNNAKEDEPLLLIQQPWGVVVAGYPSFLSLISSLVKAGLFYESFKDLSELSFPSLSLPVLILDLKLAFPL